MWERIESDGGDGPKMRRMAVPGGWLYAEYYNTQVYPVFVPQPAEQGDKVKPSDLASWLTRAVDLLAESLNKWEDEEDSVKEEKADHIADLEQFFDDWRARKVER